MSTDTQTTLILAEREAGRVADAAQEAVALIAQGRLTEADAVLVEVSHRATQARERLEACRDGR